MGAKIIIQDVDFSNNAVVAPEVVALSSLSGGYADARYVTVGETSFNEIDFTASSTWPRYEADLDLTNYKYSSKPFYSTSGSESILTLWLLDANGVVIYKGNPSLVNEVRLTDGLEINSSNYPNAVKIGYCWGSSSTGKAPVLVRENV